MVPSFKLSYITTRGVQIINLADILATDKIIFTTSVISTINLPIELI